VKVRIESRLNQGRLIEIEAKLINGNERSGDAEKPASTRALENQQNPADTAA